MGLSRDTFYRYKQAVEEGGIDSLLNKSWTKANPKNRVDEVTESAVVNYAVDVPAHGQVRVSNELRKKGIFVSPTGVRSIWLRHDLNSFKKRLKVLEEKVAREGIILTDTQVAALEKKQQDDEAAGEIETAHPCYLGSQDTLLCGHLERCWQDLPADLRRHILEGGFCQDLRYQNTDYGSRSTERSGIAVLRTP